MADQPHPLATHQLPAFITGPGETDVLMVITAILLGASVVGFGILYFRLHALPEHMAHKGQKVQFEIVALLALIALFTHMHIFWIAALLLAFIDLPDFGGFLGRIAGSVERMAGVKPGRGADEGPAEVGSPRDGELEPQRHGAVATAAAQPPKRPMTRGKELDHA